MQILVIQTAFIGDVVLITPLITEIKSRFKDCKLHLLLTPQGKEILEEFPNIVFHTLDKKKSRVSEFFRLKNELNKYNFDMVFCIHRSLRSLMIARVVGAKKKYAFTSIASRLFGFETIAYPKYSDATHYVDKTLELLKLAGFKNLVRSRPRLYVSKKVDIDEPYIVISPFSVWGTKMWPWIRYADVGTEIWQSKHIPLVLVGSGSPHEIECSEKIATQWRQAEVKHYNFTGKTDLKTLSAIISKAKLLISNDSAPVHIAAAFDIPTVVIFGPTVREWGFFPLSTKSKIVENTNLNCRPCSLHGPKVCPKKHFKCMNEVSTGDVSRVALSFMI